ncbi:MAG: hypothetical protein L0206_15475 [Actinobacteria bacterium]|nr:hypothetical protein [Actinomycetota bacterium]
MVLEVSAGAARIEGGAEPFSGALHITAIPAAERPRLSLPEGVELSVLVAIEPSGVTYDPPAAIAFPNVERFPAGAVVDIFGLDRETGEMEKVGEGIARPDGLIHSTGGVVTESSWYGMAPRRPVGHPAAGSGPPSPRDRDDEPVGSTVSPRTGDLTVGHDLVAYHSLGIPRSLRLEYHTSAASPRPIVAASVTTANLSPPPELLAAEVTVAGVSHGREVTEAPPACVANCPLIYLARAVDASALATGVYPASIAVDYQFPLSRRRVELHMDTVVINHRASPFGVGWNVKGLQRLHRASGGGFLITSGDDSAAVFRPAARVAAEIRRVGERDFYHFAANRGEVVTLAMSRTSNRAGGSGSLDPAIELRSSGGVVLARDAEAGTDVPGGPGRNATIRSLALPATDTYTIVASGRGGSRGSYHLTLSAADGRELAGGRVGGPGSVRPAFAFQGEITSVVRRRTHTFAASAGTRVTIAVNRLDNLPGGQGTLDPSVELRSSLGIVVGRDSDGGTDRPEGPGRNALISNLTLPATDAYEIVVSGTGSTSGPYEITITFDALTGSVQTGNEGPVSIERALIPPPGDGSELTVNEDGSVARRLKNGSIVTFDADGLQTAVADRHGNTASYTYDAQDRLVRIEDPVGLVTRLGYSSGRLAEIEGPAGRITRFEHDAFGNLIGIEDPDGTRRSFAYDGAGGLMTSQTNQRDFVTRYEYDFSGRLARSRLPDGSERSLVASESVGLVDPASGLGTEASPAPFVRADRIASELTDGEGRARSFLTGTAARFTAVTSAAGVVTEIARDDSGRATGAMSAGGLDYSYSYDDRGNLGSVTDERLGGTLLFGYDPRFSQPASVTDGADETGTVDHDDRGRPIRITTAAGRVATLAYDERGLLRRVTDQIGAVTTFTYDDRGNVTAVVRSAGGEERGITLGYTPEGYLASYRDALGNQTRYRYDVMGRLRSLIRPDEGTTRLEYDAAGNLISLEPAGRPAHRFAYSPVNLMEEYTPPVAGGSSDPTAYVYSRASELTRVSRPDGRSVVYEHDDGGRTSALSLPRGEIRYSFQNRTGLLLAVTAPDGSTVSHDYAGGRLIRVTWAGSVAGSVGRSYDSSGRVGSYDVNRAPVVEYERDADGLLVRAGELVLDRDPQGGFVSGTKLGRVRDLRTYSVFGELLEYAAWSGGSEIYREEHARDALGRVAGKTVTIDGRRDRATYRYDATGRLVTIEKDGAVEMELTYDQNGNRLARAGVGPTVNGDYDERDRLLSYGSTVYAYNRSGELERKTAGGQVTAYDHDAVGNLLGVSLPDGRRIDYVLDGRHRRIGKVVDGTPSWRLLYKDELHPIAELDGAGAVVSVFVYATRSSVPDYMVRDGETYRVVADHLGSPRLVVNTRTGEIAQRLDYDAFGRVVLDTRRGFQPFGFAGGIYDPDTALVRFGVRDYDAETGRWIRPSPVCFGGGEANLYLYAGGDPVSRVDPSGMRGDDSLAWGSAASVGAALSGQASRGFTQSLAAAGAVAGGLAREDIRAMAAAFLKAREVVDAMPHGLVAPGLGDDGSSPAEIHDPADAGVPPVGAGGSADPPRAGIPPGDADGRGRVGRTGADDDAPADPCGGEDVCPVLVDGRLECVPCASIGF